MAKPMPQSTIDRLTRIRDRILYSVSPEDYKFVKNCYKRFGKKAIFDLMGFDAIVFIDMQIDKNNL